MFTKIKGYSEQNNKQGANKDDENINKSHNWDHHEQYATWNTWKQPSRLEVKFKN